MNNCLVTRLETVVNNDNLPYYDTLDFNVVKSSSATFNPTYHSLKTLLGNDYADNYKLIFKGEGYRCDENGDEDANGDYFSDGDYTFTLVGRSALTQINIVGTMSSAGDVLSISNVEELKNCHDMVYLAIQTTNNHFSGNIETLGNLVKLNQIFLKCVKYATGDFTTLLQKLVDNGRRDIIRISFDKDSGTRITFTMRHLTVSDTRKYVRVGINSDGTEFTLTALNWDGTPVTPAIVDTWRKTGDTWALIED